LFKSQINVNSSPFSITEAVNFETDEALLTGESLPSVGMRTPSARTTLVPERDSILHIAPLLPPRVEPRAAFYTVAISLSMIPVSLVVVLTITTSAGTKRMALLNVIMRNLKSLEALGAVTDICSDKTGTFDAG